MTTGLRPDLIVRQIFRTAQPVVPASALPAVLVGVHRQLEYQKSAGSFVGGQDNGDYNFPDLIAASAVEPTTQADPVLRPTVFIKNEHGIADVTADVTFQNLNNPATIPIFNIAAGADATFEAASGTTGSYDSTTGKFTDPNADFIEKMIGANDVIKVSGVDAFSVTALVSDDELTVTRINHGPPDAFVQLGAKDSFDVRVLTYRGATGGTNAFEGFVTGGTKVGELVTFDGWSPRTNTGGLSYTATDANGHRTLTSTADFNPVNVAVGDVVVIQNPNDPSKTMPAFVVTDPTGTGNDDATAANLTSVLLTTALAGGTSDFPERFFQTYEFNTDVRETPSNTGFFTARNATTKLRTFSDASADFGAAPLLQAGDWIMVHSAHSGTLNNTVTFTDGANPTVARGDGGSWIDDGFAANMVILITTATSATDVGEYTIQSLTASTLTLAAGTTTTGLDAGDVVVVSRDATVMFEVDTAPTLGSGATSFTVTDAVEGLIADAQIGGPLRYTIVRPSAIATSVSNSADVTDVDATNLVRYLEWPVAFTAGTMPVAGDFVYNDEGVLLFNVSAAVRVTPTEHVNLDFATAGNTITRDTGSWLTDGFRAGDQFQVFNATNSANDKTYLVSSVTAAEITVDATTPVGANTTDDTTAEVTKVEMTDHTQAGFDVPDADILASVGLIIRQADQAAYSVVRVVSETEIHVRHVVSGDEVTDQTVLGMTTLVTVPDTLTNVSYTVEKTLTGGALTGEVLVSYAARRTDLSDQLIEVDQGNVEDTVGFAVPGNPLGLAAINAVANTGVRVLLVQVESDDQAGWASAMDFIKTDQVYAVAPLTQTEARLQEFQSHVSIESQPENKRERILFQSHRTETQLTRFTMDPAADTADLVYDGTTQTLTLTHTGGVVALGVIAGDVVEGTFSGYIPGTGFTTGSVNARVVSVSEAGSVTTLTLLPDTTVPVTLSGGVRMDTLLLKSKVLSTAQLRDAVAAYPPTVKDRRVRNVYPDRALITFTDTTNPNDETTGLYGGGEIKDHEVGGWLMAAIAASQRSGLPASTPLTKRPFSGIQRLVNPFGSNISDLDKILDNGNYLLAQPGGENAGVEAVRAISTDTTDLNFLEEAVTVQIDNFARKLRRQVVPILGSTVLDENFFDLFSTISSAVVTDVLSNREMRELDLVSMEEDPNRADTFLANYNARPFFSAAKGDVTIFI